MTLNRGTPITMAPEIIRGSKQYTAKCDVYSFGIIMWQVIARRDSPYLASHPHDALVIYWNIVAKNLRPPELSCNPILSRFYERCWDDDPDKRPDSQQVMRYFAILKKAFPNGDDPLIDANTNEPAVTPQPKSNGAPSTSAIKEVPTAPNLRSTRSHSEATCFEKSLA
ncbi:hypothetical protein OESDEN_25357, partial [Oesophagostomum dentatum]